MNTILDGEFLVSQELLNYWYPGKKYHWSQKPLEDDPHETWWDYDLFRPTHMIELVHECQVLASDLVVLEGRMAFSPQDKTATENRIPLYGFEDNVWWNYLNESPMWKKAEIYVQKATWVENNSSVGWVYFIQSGTADLIKIGWSKQPKKRLASLQIANPDKLTILGVIPGHMTEEKKLHKFFAQDRKHGEWFHLSQSIQDFMDKNILPIK